MMVAVARQIPAADQSTQAGKWEKSAFMGAELTGKRLGLLRQHRLNRRRPGTGLPMKVMAFDPFLTEGRAQVGVAKVELDGWRSLFITLHTPLTDSTRDIVGASALRQNQKGVRIINCARGVLIVEEALRAASIAAMSPAPPRRVRGRTGQGQCAVRGAQPGGDASSRRRDHGGAGKSPFRWPNKWLTTYSPGLSPTPSTCPRQRRGSAGAETLYALGRVAWRLFGAGHA